MDKPKNMLIGEMLVEEGIISKEQLKDGLEEQKRSGEKIGQILIKMGYISKEILWTFLGYQMGVPYINLDEVPDVRQDVLKMFPEQLMRNEKLIPLNKQGRVITVAMADPMNFLVVDDLKATTRCEVDVRLSPADDIKKQLDKYFGFKDEETGEIAKASVGELDDILASPTARRPKSEEPALKITRMGDAPKPQRPAQPQTPQYMPPPPPQFSQAPQPQYTPPPPPPQQHYSPPPPPPQPQYAPPVNEGAQAVMAQDTPVNTFLTTLLSEAYDSGATDVHIEPFTDICRIRKRMDGALYEVESPPKTLYNGMLNKIKELAQMNVQERNVPQESKLKIRVSGKEINMAVYTFPTIFGEKIVLKLLRADTSVVPLDEIGMDDADLEIFKSHIKMPYGLVVITGPTSSGKATTMYSAIAAINQPTINIFSIDDTSSNYIIPGVNQAKVNRKNFGQVLRYLSEQDCDVIAVGDIVNKETAEAVFDVIAGGHLVISKMRANDQFQALQSMIGYGIEPYIVYSSTLLVANQRLMRKVCQQCKEAYEAPPEIIKLLGGASTKKVTLYKGRGCTECSGTGYKGRTAVFEMLAINDKIRDMLSNKEPLKKIKDENAKNGMKSLKEAALLKVIQGVTTVEEYMKIS